LCNLTNIQLLEIIRNNGIDSLKLEQVADFDLTIENFRNLENERYFFIYKFGRKVLRNARNKNNIGHLPLAMSFTRETI
jgi:hypothetical protein